MYINKVAVRTITILFAIFQLSYYFLIASPTIVKAETPFSTAYTTLTNSRFSYKAALSAAIAANVPYATIATSGQSDNNTGNLFDGDVICINGYSGGSANGCVGNTTYTINSVPDSSHFGFTPSNGSNTASISDFIVATQAARITVTFTPTTTVPSGGFVKVIMPSATSNYANGIPDSTGFDAGLLTTGNINSYTTTSFTKSATTLTYSSSTQIITMTLGAGGIVSGTSYTITIGDVSDTRYRFVNPSPSGTSHTRGVADSYSVILQSEDSSNVVQDKNTMKIAPIDGVEVSANVEMTISYTINDASNGYSGNVGNAVDVTQCRPSSTWTTTSASTATAVPFGSISGLDTQFYQVAQTHYIVTNAEAGFDLTVVADGPMYKDGGGVTSIPHTTCAASPCTDTSPAAWTDYAGYNGLGYTLGNITGTEAAFTYSNGYKPFSTTARTVMSKASKSSGSRIASCYRLSVDTAQDTGYYWNKLTYVATPKF